MFEKIVIGWSCRRIALFLTEKGIPTPKGKGIWNGSTVARMLREEWYTETEYVDIFRWKSEQKEKDKKPIMAKRAENEVLKVKRGDLVPVIIPRELFDQAQKQLSLNKEMSLRSHKHTERLGLVRCGLCKCSICGRVMKVHYHHSNPEGHAPEYYCQVRNGGEGIVNHHSLAINMDLVDAEAWNLAKEYIADPRRIRRRVEEIRKAGGEPVDITGIDKKLAEIDRQIKNVIELARDTYSPDTIVSFRESLKVLENEKDGLLTTKSGIADEAEALAKLYAEIEKFEAWADRARTLLTQDSDIDYQTKRSTLLVLGIHATILPATVKKRIVVDVKPPDIVALLRDLVNQDWAASQDWQQGRASRS